MTRKSKQTMRETATVVVLSSGFRHQIKAFRLWRDRRCFYCSFWKPSDCVSRVHTTRTPKCSGSKPSHQAPDLEPPSQSLSLSGKKKLNQHQLLWVSTSRVSKSPKEIRESVTHQASRLDRSADDVYRENFGPGFVINSRTTQPK